MLVSLRTICALIIEPKERFYDCINILECEENTSYLAMMLKQAESVAGEEEIDDDYWCQMRLCNLLYSDVTKATLGAGEKFS